MQEYINAIIVLNKHTGDGIRFNSITQLQRDCGIFNVSVKDPFQTFNHPKFKAKYTFFAYESDLRNNTFY